MNIFKSAKERKEFVWQFYFHVIGWLKDNVKEHGCGFVVQKARDKDCKTHERYVWNLASSTTTEPIWIKMGLTLEFANEYVLDINPCDTCENRWSDERCEDSEVDCCRYYDCKNSPRHLNLENYYK